LGEPLPHQRANRARAPPPTPLWALNPRTEILGMSCGISPAFAGLSPIEGQVTHVLRTRAPCAHPLYCYRKLRTRLACVKHAASVRSEPGSNSRLKLVVLKIKNPGSAGARLPERTCYRSVYSSTERVLAHLIRLSKSRPPVRQVGFQAIAKYRYADATCQATFPIFSTSGQAAPRLPIRSQRRPNWAMLGRAGPRKGAQR